MAITFEAYARNNGAFRAARPMPSGSPVGIIIHSTGVDNPNLRRYVNAPNLCGENPWKNYFDRADSDVCPHAVIGLDKSGEVRAAKLLPWNICCWGCGDGSKGSYNYNPAYIQIEIPISCIISHIMLLVNIYIGFYTENLQLENCRQYCNDLCKLHKAMRMMPFWCQLVMFVRKNNT